MAQELAKSNENAPPDAAAVEGSRKKLKSLKPIGSVSRQLQPLACQRKTSAVLKPLSKLSSPSPTPPGKWREGHDDFQSWVRKQKEQAGPSPCGSGAGVEVEVVTAKSADGMVVSDL